MLTKAFTVVFKYGLNLLFCVSILLEMPDSLVVIIPAFCVGSLGLNLTEGMMMGNSCKSVSYSITRCKIGTGKNIRRTDTWH